MRPVPTHGATRRPAPSPADSEGGAAILDLAVCMILSVVVANLPLIAL